MTNPAEKGPIRLADYHKRILGHCFRLDEEERLPYDTIAWCEPAKSGKTAILALMAFALSNDVFCP